MRVSVVVPTYPLERFDSFRAAVESVLAQTYDPLEVVLVVDGNEAVYERTVEAFGDRADVVVHNNDQNRGVSYSRTKGAELASGDVVAMIDDDAEAEPDWVERLVAVFEGTDAVAVGGPVEPNWVGDRPAFFPEEFYWLVGCTEPGFASHMEEIRNGYGSNIAFDRETFLEVGGYDTHTGRRGDQHIQAHEAPVCIRIRRTTGKGVVYTEDAVVHHTLFAYRGDFGWLIRRSFWQGYSKRVMALLYPDAESNEGEFLGHLVFERVPGRLKGLIRSPSLAAVMQLVALFVFTAAVGLGYLYALATPGLLEKVETNPETE